MNTTLVLSILIFIFTALAIVIEIVQIYAAARSRRIVVRRRYDDETTSEIALSATEPGAGAFAGSPVAITGPVRQPVPVLARAAEPSPAVASSGNRRAVYDFVSPPPRKSRPRNVHG